MATKKDFREMSELIGGSLELSLKNLGAYQGKIKIKIKLRV